MCMNVCQKDRRYTWMLCFVFMCDFLSQLLELRPALVNITYYK